MRLSWLILTKVEALNLPRILHVSEQSTQALGNDYEEKGG